MSPEQIIKPEQTENGSCILSEIARPYSLDVRLRKRRDALLIDRRVILAYDFIPEEKGSRLLIARERSIPIVREKDKPVAYLPYPDENHRRGKYGTIFIGLRPSMPTVYIGKEYKITYKDKEGNLIAFLLESTNEIYPQSLDPKTDYAKFLERLNTPSG